MDNFDSYSPYYQRFIYKSTIIANLTKTDLKIETFVIFITVITMYRLQSFNCWYIMQLTSLNEVYNSRHMHLKKNESTTISTPNIHP